MLLELLLQDKLPAKIKMKVKELLQLKLATTKQLKKLPNLLMLTTEREKAQVPTTGMNIGLPRFNHNQPQNTTLITGPQLLLKRNDLIDDKSFIHI